MATKLGAMVLVLAAVMVVLGWGLGGATSVGRDADVASEAVVFVSGWGLGFVPAAGNDAGAADIEAPAASSSGGITITMTGVEEEWDEEAEAPG